MKTPNHPGQMLGTVLLAALVASSCSEPSTSPDRAPVRANVATASGATDKHIFSFKGSVSADFKSQVEAKGGKVAKVYDGIGVAVAKGLSDADAQTIAGNRAEVTRDVLRQMVPTLEQAQGSIQSLPGGFVPNFTAKSPLTAAFLGFQWEHARDPRPRGLVSGSDR